MTGINTNQKCQQKAKKKYLNFLIDPSFQGVNRLFVLQFDNEDDREAHIWYFLPKVKIKDYNIIITRKIFFWSNNKKRFKNIC